MARRKREPNRLLVLILAALVAVNSILVISRLGRGKPLPGEGVALPEYVTKDYIVKNSYSRPGTPLTEINGVVIHYVGNPGSSARARPSPITAIIGRQNEPTYSERPSAPCFGWWWSLACWDG